MRGEMTLAEVVAYQAEHDLKDVHLVFFGVAQWHCAHTESERVQERSGGPALSDCELHNWMADNLDGPLPSGVGLYKAYKHEPDGYSESYRGDAGPWDFDLLEAAT